MILVEARTSGCTVSSLLATVTTANMGASISGLVVLDSVASVTSDLEVPSATSGLAASATCRFAASASAAA